MGILHAISEDRGATSTIPALTASAFSGDREALLAPGFDGYIT